MSEFPTLEAVLLEMTAKVAQEYKSNLGSSAIASSLTFEVTRLGTKYECILNLAPYWQYIEYGRGFGRFGQNTTVEPKRMPPLEPILKWMARKGIRGRTGLEKPESIAFAIRRSIAKNGIKPKFALTQTQHIIDDYQYKIQEALQTDINNNTK